jgi:hypothetical protein
MKTALEFWMDSITKVPFDNLAFAEWQNKCFVWAVKEYLEQFREDTIDQAQIDWNEGLDQIIASVQTEKRS